MSQALLETFIVDTLRGRGRRRQGISFAPDVLVDNLVDRSSLLLATFVAVVLNLAFGDWHAVAALTGLWLLLGAPVILWFAAARPFVSTRDGRFLVATGLTVLTDILVALGVNTVLPWVGVAAPLRAVPLVIGSVLVIVAMAAIIPAGESAESVPLRSAPGLFAVAGTGLLAVTLSVAGPTRLNNGFGGTVAVLALLAVAGLMTQLFLGRRRHPAAVTALGIFFVALSLLLLTSLRGWFISGHDIQLEYGVFQLAQETGRWSIAAFRNPYNACLSVNLLPVSFAELTGIPGTYVFKVLLPVLFAVAPAALYRAVRNTAPQSVALLSAFYFVAFPTFFTDMAFLTRQEIAFLLLACAMVVLTDSGRPLRARRIAVTVLLTGIVLSHYSTTYVVLATLGIAYLAGKAVRLAGRFRGRPAFLTWWMFAITAVTALLWTGPATHTSLQAQVTTRAVVQELLGKRSATGSSDTAYSLFGGEKISAEQRLDDYTADTTRSTSQARKDGDFLPLKVIRKHPTGAVEQADMPLTFVGRLLGHAGVNVSTANTVVRQSAARLLQLLLLIGLVLTVVGRRRIFRATADQLTLGVGAMGVLGVLTVLPELSVDYGVLRAFQQGLFFFTPFIAAASIWIFRWAGRRAAVLGFGLCALLFLDLVGVVPKVLGGYPPQLHLANSGQYYDIYYVHPEERSGIDWLRQRPPGDDVQTDSYNFDRLPVVLKKRATNDIYPTLIGSNSYVFLGYTTVRKDEATVFYRGDLVTYRYPIDLLDSMKNKVYSNDGAEVYR
ncbi:DUF2206 domain-containing protein [Paractinoplanes durhamensis]|uniref:DUF2206 domain-containing protein n=1 Tax=Paractinoplanes durhamensis TaxID=113563 RepID=A0ABQ3Z9Z0_9ACTN|nr:DUF2206 domain-containing protein [Actinoplanes durhamensis]GIE06630.1 hypothetical protein Adu01nite_79800 [Actinoplanes durhamensis]